MLSESKTSGHNYKLEKSKCNTTFRLNQFSQSDQQVECFTSQCGKCQISEFF